MSTPQLDETSPLGPLRRHVPGVAERAVAKARLRLVPRRRTQTPRVPFVTLVSLVLVAGVVGLLLFNTSMQQASFAATGLEDQARTLVAREQTLRMELDDLRDPQRVAEQAQALGMVPAGSPAFLQLSDGKVVGVATPATAENGLRIRPLPPRKPASLTPDPIIHEVIADEEGADTGPGRQGSGRGDREDEKKRDRRQERRERNR
jgi:cell division protein FtsB